MEAGLWFALVCAVIAIVYGGVSSQWILAQPAGNERMREIALAIQTGAKEGMISFANSFKNLANKGLIEKDYSV